MIQFRKNTPNNRGAIYATNPVIRVAKSTRASFIVSKLVPKMLNMDIDKQGLMFGIKNKKVIVSIEPKEFDNYHLNEADVSTLRFTSVDLYQYLVTHLKLDTDKNYFLELQSDLTFKIV